MNSVNGINPSVLTQSDITRLPQNSVTYQNTPTQTYQPDVYEPQQQSSSGLKKLIIGLALVAGGIVGAKYLGKDSFLKYADNSDKFLDKAKKFVIDAADYIEKPFKWSYEKIANLFNKK